jgi:hypothetical protein
MRLAFFSLAACCDSLPLIVVVILSFKIRLIDMEQSIINYTVKNCVREVLGEREPLIALQSAINRLAAAGWPKAEVGTLRNTALQMISARWQRQPEASGLTIECEANQSGQQTPSPYWAPRGTPR